MHIPEVNLPTDDIEALYKRDFYFSFLHSQGSAELQRRLFCGMAVIYKANLTDDQQKAMIAASHPSKTFRWPVPQRHTNAKVNDHYRDGVYNENQSRLYNELIGGFSEPSTWPAVLRSIGMVICTETINKDEEYLRAGTKRGLDGDPHASLFRRYILLGQAAKTVTFTAVYGLAQQAWRETMAHGPLVKYNETFNTLNSLVPLWEQNHPGEQFYDGVEPALLPPSSLAPNALASQTQL